MRHALLLSFALALAACSGSRPPQSAVTAEQARLEGGGTEVPARGGAGGAEATGAGGVGGAAVSRETCVDAWLKARGLNEFGDPPGTMYMGGTPLFDEATGERRDRIEYVIEKHPEVAQACP